MKYLEIIRCVAISVAFLVTGCNASSTAEPIPTGKPGAQCDATSAQSNLTICVLVPPNAEISSLEVTDTLYGRDIGAGKPAFQPSQCPMQGGEHVCVAHFAAPIAVNDVTVTASGASRTANASFPVDVLEGENASRRVVLSGAIAGIAVVPFLSTIPPCEGKHKSPLGKYSCLALGSKENLWVVATDTHGSVIAGDYSPAISLRSTANIVLSPRSQTTLHTSADAANLTVSWKSKLLHTTIGALRAASGQIKDEAHLAASSGAVYFAAGPDTSRVAGGPVAVGTDGNVYFTINDQNCHRAGACLAAVAQFSPATQKFREVSLPDVPGVSQLAATSDGALWMATYQPVGNWNAPLPIMHMKPGGFSSGGLETLPESFGEGSGFAESGSGNLWISGCLVTGCQQNRNGQPVVVETTLSGEHTTPLTTVTLPRGCTHFGYLGYNVGDVALLGGSLYVIGLNDGSPPPARGTIWQVSGLQDGPSASCIRGLFANFNPSPYFAQVNDVLYFGVGGNPKNVHWGPQTGFYALTQQLSTVKVTLISAKAGTANHLSQNNGVLYYTTDGERNIQTSGLGTYSPATNEWNLFPTTTFFGQYGNGVDAVPDGAWFTAGGTCRAWKGVCLGRAIYLGTWSPIPELELPALSVGGTTTLGIFANPNLFNNPTFRPLNVHSGPFSIVVPKGLSSPACSIDYTQPPQSLTFVVTGTAQGTCLLNIIDKRNRKQSVITTVSGPGSE